MSPKKSGYGDAPSSSAMTDEEMARQLQEEDVAEASDSETETELDIEPALDTIADLNQKMLFVNGIDQLQIIQDLLTQLNDAVATSLKTMNAKMKKLKSEGAEESEGAEDRRKVNIKARAEAKKALTKAKNNHIYTLQLRFNGQIFQVHVKGRGTLKTIRNAFAVQMN